MKRLSLIASAGAIVLAGCGSPADEQVRHIVALPAPPPAAEGIAPPVTIPPITAPPITAPPRPAAARASRSGGRGPGGDVWAALAQCESGGNASAGGRYRGAFQFSPATWRSLGYSGDPAAAPYEVQKQAAQRLVARSGWGQFPHCSRKLGMR